MSVFCFVLLGFVFCLVAGYMLYTVIDSWMSHEGFDAFHIVTMIIVVFLGFIGFMFFKYAAMEKTENDKGYICEDNRIYKYDYVEEGFIVSDEYKDNICISALHKDDKFEANNIRFRHLANDVYVATDKVYTKNGAKIILKDDIQLEDVRLIERIINNAQ